MSEASTLFAELFAANVGKIDAVIEAIGGVYTGHDGADFCLEANDLIGERYLCQALLNTDGATREWSIYVRGQGENNSWKPRESFYVSFKAGKVDTIRVS